MTKIATYIPREVETKVIQEEQITLNLTLDQAKVVAGCLGRANGKCAYPVYKDLLSIFNELGVKIPNFTDMNGNSPYLDAHSHGL